MRLEGPIVNSQCWIQVLTGDPARSLHGGRVQHHALTPVNALIDTGATTSAVSIEFARQLGLVGRTSSKVSGVGGLHESQQAPALIGFQYDGSTFFRILPMLILPLGIPMLLGMDDILAGTLHVDGPRGKWTWSISTGNVKNLGDA